MIELNLVFHNRETVCLYPGLFFCFPVHNGCCWRRPKNVQSKSVLNNTINTIFTMTWNVEIKFSTFVYTIKCFAFYVRISKTLNRITKWESPSTCLCWWCNYKLRCLNSHIMEICGFVLVIHCIFSMLEHSETKLQDVPFFSHLMRVEKERSTFL